MSANADRYESPLDRIHRLAVHALDTRGMLGLTPSDEDRAYNALLVIAKLTDVRPYDKPQF